MTSGDDEQTDTGRNGPSHEEHDARVTTEDEFHEALQTIVTAADENGVDVRGGWPIAGTDDETAWDVEITRITGRPRTRVRDLEFPASSIVDEISTLESVDTTDLPPLYDAIGPDILETIHEADGDIAQSVTFEYYGYRITVESDNTITIAELR